MYAESSQVEYSFFEIFQIVDLQVFALPRITLKPLVPTFPCFAKILVSLMEKVWRLIAGVWIILVHHFYANVINFAATCWLWAKNSWSWCNGYSWSLQICSGIPDYGSKHSHVKVCPFVTLRCELNVFIKFSEHSKGLSCTSMNVFFLKRNYRWVITNILTFTLNY